jgi:type II secretory pathway pseudopilin PulG
MSLLSSMKARLARAHGFTLIEMLVATAAGMIVLLAAFALLDVSASQSSRIGDKVDADQQARTAMENIMLELHSSCVAAATTPVQAGSDDTSIGFISQMGSNSNFQSVDLHVIHLSGLNLIDDAYQSDVGTVAPAWTFPYPGAPTSSRTLLDHVSQAGGGTQPIFQYYRYYNSSDVGGVLGEIDPTPLTTPLSAGDAQLTTQVNVGFTVGPESGNPEPTRAVNLNNTAVLRFSPSSGDPTTTNTACS